MKKTLVWRFDDEVDRMLPIQAVRVTVRTVTMRDFGEFQRLTRLATQLWEGKFPLVEAEPGETEGKTGGETGGEPVDVAAGNETGKPKQARPEGSGIYLDIYRRWARLAPATAVVETITLLPAGKGKKQPTEVDWEATPDTWLWAPSSLSALGWDQPDPAMDLPADFFFAWEQAVLDVNPGIWGNARTSDAPGAKKKTTGLMAIY